MAEVLAAIRYDAFISYRRSDGGRVARWLRRQLLWYRLPRSMRERSGRRLRIYIDTTYELGAADFYEQNVKPALLSSSHLIVVATPDAVQRAVRVAGDFAGPLPGDLAIRFPNIEIVDLRGAGAFWYLNPTRVSRLASEKLKIVAPLLDIPI